MRAIPVLLAIASTTRMRLASPKRPSARKLSDGSHTWSPPAQANAPGETAQGSPPAPQSTSPGGNSQMSAASAAFPVSGSDPLSPDSDGDGFGDGAEVGAGSDPNDAQSIPTSVPAVGPLGGLVLTALFLLAGLRRVRSERPRRGPSRTASSDEPG